MANNIARVVCLAVCLVVGISGTVAAAESSADIVIADFEAADYGNWKIEGDAFGTAPAKGTLPDQMSVEGFLGKGSANSYHKGDGATGSLTSPLFTVERRYLRFLIGGGGYANETCMNLLVDGKVVRTATGPNTRPGGSERLDWQQWDVAEFNGQQAILQIVDRRKGGWGHINVDHIVQTDSRLPVLLENVERRIQVEKRYVNLPVKNGAPKRLMSIAVDGQEVRRFEIELADEKADWWAFVDLSAYQGKQATLKLDKLLETSSGLSSIEQSDLIKGADPLYREKFRPQFHFSSRRGWLNDPNGLVYYDGEYHLFYQHNPYGWDWGNMHWGHAVSKDLIHWEELPIALYRWTMAKDHAFSGTAVVDWNNTSGFQTGKEKVLVAAFTDTGCGESIAYSNDRGRTWTYWPGNPVIKHEGRDPKVFWYAPGKHWSMALYDESEGKRWITFYTSADLKNWQYQSRIEGFFECPEVFELPVDGDSKNTRWVLYAADAKYVLGRFDGKTFTPEHSGKHQVHWGAYYASLTFNDMPDGRRVQIGWGQIAMRGMPFNQMMAFPCELSLRTTDDGIRMFAQPVKEIGRLRAKSHERQDVRLVAGQPMSLPVAGDLFEIRAEFEIGQAKSLGLRIGERKITYDAAKNSLEGMPLKPVAGRVRLQVLVDRPSLELCGNDGRVFQTNAFQNSGPIEAIHAWCEGGDARLVTLEVHELKSIWK